MDLRKNCLLKNQLFKRNSRFYQIANLWFFNTREGKHMGPYESEVKAELEFLKFIRVLTRIENNKKQASHHLF